MNASTPMLATQRPHGLRAMRRGGFGSTLLLLALLALVAPLAAVLAIGAPAAHAAPVSRLTAETHSAPTQTVTILVLDMSGSMGNPGGSGNDPDGLRCVAADAFISLSEAHQFVGVVGLVGEDKAQNWASPVEMSTSQARDNLIQTIKEKSQNCRAGGDTPTFDALSKAYAMLQSTVTGGGAGSVILLTDGVPTSNTGESPAQLQNDIDTQLIPKFKSSGFPINVIMLGNDPANYVLDHHGFLQGMAAGTNGQFDSDVNPTTQQVDALKIAPALLDYFAALTGRTPTLASDDTLNGSVTQRNVTVDPGTPHLDVVVITQDPSAQISLSSPDGMVYTAQTPSGNGYIGASDHHYAVFSIDGPSVDGVIGALTAGAWTISITGGSRGFSIYTLAESNLRIALTQPKAKQPPYPVNQSVPISAQLTNNGIANDENYTVTALLQSGGQLVAQNTLAHQAGSNIYDGSLSLPQGSYPGSYTLILQVTRGGGNPLARTDPQVIDFEVFPQPYLLNNAGAQVTAVTTTVTAFPGIFQAIYGLPIFRLPIISWFRGFALSGIPATPSAVVNGVLTSNGSVYTKSGSVVTGSAVAANQKAAQATFANTAPGHFQVIFPATGGTYHLSLSAKGDYEDSHGSFGPPTTRSVTLTVVPATGGQDVRAFIVTVMYVALLILIALLARMFTMPSPEGVYQIAGDDPPRSRPFKLQRSWWMHLLHRNRLPSRPTFGKTGLELQVWGRSIAARRQGPGAEHWYDSAGRPLGASFRPVSGVQYKPTLRRARHDDEDEDNDDTTRSEGNDDELLDMYTYTFPPRGGRSGGRARGASTRRRGESSRPARGSRGAKRGSRGSGRGKRGGKRNERTRDATQDDDL